MPKSMVMVESDLEVVYVVRVGLECSVIETRVWWR